MVKIMWIDPISSKKANEKIRKTINGIKRPDVEATAVYPKRKRTTHVKHHYYEHLNLHGTL